MRKVAKIPLPDAVTDRAVSPLVDRFNETIDIPILQGRLLERVDITEGTTTKYRHGLGRKLRGWIIVKSNITDRGLVYDKQDDNKREDEELWLFLNTGGTSDTFQVSLWVF